MKKQMKYFFGFLLLYSNVYGQTNVSWSHGGIIRGDTTQKSIALIFSADADGEGVPFIDSVLHSENIKGSFFFTGNYLTNPENKMWIESLINHGNYISTHSYGHLLYCDWANRDSLLVTQETFNSDMDKSFAILKQFDILKSKASYFLPPYEWYNDTISTWARQAGLQVIEFTPGTYSNADYTTPDMGKKYLSSNTIFNRILHFESAHKSGLNGFFLLVHAGSSPLRTDKFYWKLPALLKVLKSKGYRFFRVDELIEGKRIGNEY
ncbi:MAG: polysaccharide deacetylase family protein [Chitinophagaceae bacterium]|nr:polysaccharide deacetylase family protein [Chitinophagaceae bacterium]